MPTLTKPAKPAATPPPPRTKKSREKSRPLTGRPFQRGGPQGPGRGPKKGAPNAGRPKDKIVELAAQGLEKALPLLIQTALGKPTEIQKDDEGNETGYTVSASANERSKAVEVLGKVARKIGARIEVDNVSDKPFVVIVRPE